MPLPPTFEELQRIQRDAEKLLRGLELELKQTLIAEKDPAGVILSWRSKLDALTKVCDERSKPPTPKPAVNVLASIETETRKRFEELARRARNAHAQRDKADGKWTRAYNDAVSGGLAQAPGAAVKAGNDQIARAVKQLVDGALPASMVRSEQAASFGQAKQQIATSLTKWVQEQAVTEDAFFVAQSTLLDVSQFLQRQLTIHSQVRELKTWTETTKTLDASASKQVDAQAGVLGKAWNQGVAQGETAIKKSATFKSDVRLEPRFVLDPSKKFLSAVNAKAGITIESAHIKIQLSGHISIEGPLLDSRQVSGGQDFKLVKGPWSLTEKLAIDHKGATDFSTGLNYTKGNFTGGASYENKQGVETVKASITFRF